MIPINRPVRAVTRDGKVINGRRLNEDTYTVQLDGRGGTAALADEIRPARVHHLNEVDHALLRKRVDAGGNGRRRVVPAFLERPMTMRRDWICVMLLARTAARARRCVCSAQAPVTYERLLNAAKEPQNYLTYGGDYSSTRYSTLTQITPANVKSLNLAWVYQAPVTGSWQPTPLVVDGIMYLTQRPNDVIALDATTGRVFWIYRYTNADVIALLRLEQSRRGDSRRACFTWARSTATSSPSTRRSGRQVWKTRVADSKQGYSITVSPLALKDRIVVGVGGGEYGIRGFIYRVRRADRQRDVAVLHDSRSGRAGTRNVGGVPAQSEDLLRSRGVEARRRHRCGSPDPTIPSST